MAKNKNQIWHFIYKLHRYLGLSSAIVLIMLSITGIALNHTETLKLDSQMIKSNAILDWYGIKSPQNLKAFATQHHWLTQINQEIYFDQTALLPNERGLLGAVETEEFIVVGLENSIFLLSLQGEVIEQSTFDAIEKIGIDHHQNIILKSNQRLMYSDDGLLSWHPYVKINPKKQMITWSKTSKLPNKIAESIKSNFRSSILPLERIVLDIHSGRFFGLIGVIIVDISGIFLIILSLSGCSIWAKNKIRVLQNRRRKP